MSLALISIISLGLLGQLIKPQVHRFLRLLSDLL